MKLAIVELGDMEREWASELLENRWGSSVIVTRGKLHYIDKISGFIAVINNEPQGLITYEIRGKECEIITLDSLSETRGIGTALIEAVKTVAVKSGCHRLWLITTNDNTAALRFYQKRGFELVAVHRNAIQESRKLKPEIPLKGIDGIPIRDEIEFELILN